MPEHIMFALEQGRRVDGDNAIYPMSLLFKAGEYKDKSYTMSGDEIRAAVEGFTPIGGNIEHTNFLKGRACQVRRVWAEGDTLHGEVAVPLGLDALLTDDERKLSCEWNRDTKRMSGIALCMKPRVSEAALMSELAGSDVNALEDSLVKMSGMRHSAPDRSLIQEGHGLVERVRQVFVGLGAAEGSAAEEAREAPAQEAAEDAAHMSKGDRTMTDAQDPTKRGFVETVSAWFNGTDVTEAERTQAEARFAENVTPITVRETVAPKADPEKDAMRREIERLRQRDIDRDAAAFADGEIDAKRAMPGEKAALVAEFMQAAHDDLAAPAVVTFAIGETTVEGTRTDAVRARHAIRIPHRLTEELVKNMNADETMVLMSAMTTRKEGDEKAPTDQRLKELKEASALGRASLAAEQRDKK